MDIVSVMQCPTIIYLQSHACLSVAILLPMMDMNSLSETLSKASIKFFISSQITLYLQSSRKETKTSILSYNGKNGIVLSQKQNKTPIRQWIRTIGWNRIRDPGINSHTYNHMFFETEVKDIICSKYSMFKKQF